MLRMRLFVAALALLSVAAVPQALADSVSVVGGLIYIDPDESPSRTVVCTVAGVTMLTPSAWMRAHPDDNQLAMIGKLKPVPGWCIQKQPLKVVPFARQWEGYNVINLGTLGNVMGMSCTIANDRMSFSCDWPPYVR